MCSTVNREPSIEDYIVEAPAIEALSTRQVLKKTQLKSRQSVYNRLKQGRLIGWKTAAGNYVFPPDQFGSDDNLQTCFPELLDIISDHNSLWCWLTSPHIELNYDQPLEFLKKGKFDIVLRLAKAYSEGAF